LSAREPIGDAKIKYWRDQLHISIIQKST